MKLFPDDRFDLGRRVHLVSEDDHCSVYRIEDSDGCSGGGGLMTCYRLLPGIVLMHCDMHLSRFCSDLKFGAEMLCIDHCREGRMEGWLDNGQVIILDPGST